MSFSAPCGDPRAPLREEPTREDSAGPTGAAGWESRTGPATVPPFGSAFRHSPKPAPCQDPVPVPPWHQGHSRVLVSLTRAWKAGNDIPVPGMKMKILKDALMPCFTPNHGTGGRTGRPGAGHQCQDTSCSRECPGASERSNKSCQGLRGAQACHRTGCAEPRSLNNPLSLPALSAP